MDNYLDNAPNNDSIEYQPDQPQAIPSIEYNPDLKTVPDDAIPTLAGKAHMALGEVSPGIPTISTQLANGQENILRQTMLKKNALDFQQQKINMVHNLIQASPDGVNPNDADFINGMTKQDYDEVQHAPSVLETTYAKKFMQTIVTKDSSQSFAKTEVQSPEYANQKLDIAEFATARANIAQRELADIQEQRKQQGWGGYLADTAGAQLLPLAAVRLENMVKSPSITSLLPGKNMQQQIEYLNTLDPVPYQAALHAALASTNNLQLREQFASAAIQQSDSDAALTSFGTAADLAGLLEFGIGAAVKGAAKLGLKGAAKGAAEAVSPELKAALESQLKSAVTAAKDPTLDPVKILGQTGNFKDASVLNAVRRADPNIPLSDEELVRQNALSINGGGNRWFTGSGANLAREVMTDHLAVAKNSEHFAEDFLNGASVDRTSTPERLAIQQELYDRTIASNPKSIAGSVLDVDSSGTLLGSKKSPYTVDTEEVLNHPIPGTVRHTITDSNGNQILQIRGRYDAKSKSFDIDNIARDLYLSDVTTDPNTLGPSVIRNVLRNLKETYPKLEKISGERLTGARSGSADIVTTKVLPNKRISGQKFFSQENALTNTESIHITLGKKTGELFDNAASARKFARDNLGQYKLDLTGGQGSNLVSHQGKWAIRLDVDAPDTLDNFKDIAIPVNDKFNEGFFGGTLKGFLGKIRNQANVLGQANMDARRTIAHGNQRLYATFQEMVKPIAALNKEERKRLGQILSNNRDFVDRVSGERGQFFASRGDFEDAYRAKWNTLPNAKETQAYYAYVQANQLDGMVRNAGWARDKIRMDLKTISDTHSFPTPGNDTVSQKWVPFQFEGKRVHSIPWDDGHNTLIALRDSETGGVRYIQKRYATKPEKELITKELNGNARIYQASDGHLTLPGKDSDRPVSHYISATSKEDRISINGPWKDGGHVLNEHTNYIKQPIRNGDYYAGDTAVATAPNDRVAAQRAEAFEIARGMMNRGDSRLDAYVSENIGNGLTGKSFMDMFEGQRTADGIVRKGLSKDQPFVWTRSGEKTVDRWKTSLKVGENPYNLLDLDRHFSGERDAGNIPALIDEKNVRQIFEDGKLIDPFETLTQAAKSAVDVRLKRDYLLKSGLQFTRQFKDILSDDHGPMTAMQQLYNPTYLKSVDKVLLNNAENARKSILRFAGSLDGQERVFESLKAKMGEIAYGALGDKKYNLLENWMLPVSKNPGAVARSIAADLKIGLFAPTQLFMQAQTLVNVLAISPRAGLKGLASYYPLRVAMMNPNMLEHSVSVASKFGWREDHFREMYASMIKSGWSQINGDMAIIDDISNPNLFRSKGGKIIDAGRAFFIEGERIHRLSGYGAAYQEWRTANPIAIYDRAAQQSVLSRADVMTAHMSAANNANWQKGIFSIPAQFMNYQARIMESYFGKTLTGAEKARLFASQAIMYGIPTAVGGVVGVWPIFDSVKSYLIDHNIPHDDAATEALLNGIPQLAMHLITGSEFDVGKRFGQGGIDAGRQWLRGDKSTWQILGGASGSVLGDVISTSIPFARALWSSLSEDPRDSVYPLDLPTISRFFENVTSINSAIKLGYAMNTGRWMSRYDIAQDKVTPFEAIFMSLTGANLTELNEMYTSKEVIKDRKNLADQTSKIVQDYLRRGFMSDDPKQRAEYFRMGAAAAMAGGMTEHEKEQAKQAVLMGAAETSVDAIARRLKEDSFKRGLDH